MKWFAGIFIAIVGVLVTLTNTGILRWLCDRYCS